MLGNRSVSVEEFFKRYPPVRQKIRIRGGDEVWVCVSSARLHVHAHKQKRFATALKYEGETECRYPEASDMTWQTLDMVQVHASRWLTGVFFKTTRRMKDGEIWPSSRVEMGLAVV